MTKVGAGTVTLGGVNTYLRRHHGEPAANSSGVVGGSCASSAVEVQPGTHARASRFLTTRKQWTCASLTFDDSTTTSEFNFGSVTPSTTLAPLNVTGAIIFNGTPTVTILAAGSLPAGTYPLMTAAGGLSGSVPTTANLSLPPHVAGYLSNDGVTLSLVVTGNTEPLKWAVNGTWGLGHQHHSDLEGQHREPANYLESATTPPVGDEVVFDDTYVTTSPTVTLNTTVTPVSVTANTRCIITPSPARAASPAKPA